MRLFLLWGRPCTVLESPQLNAPLLYLASNSPRRRQLLALAGWDFIPWPAGVDETPLAEETPARYVLRLAQAKAEAAAQTIPAAGIILAADTAVVDPAPPPGEPAILGKPVDSGSAAAMLRRLRNRIHLVYTGIAVLRSRDQALYTDLSVSSVPMRAYSDVEIDTYVATGDPLDKAGGYAIQHQGFHPVEGFSGCTASVMGLPLCHAAHLLELAGAPDGNGWAVACLADCQARCPADMLAR